MAEGFIDALIKRLADKGEDVSRVLSPSSSLGDRLGAGADLAFTPVQALQGGYEAVLGANRAVGDYNRAQGGVQGAIASALPSDILDLLAGPSAGQGLRDTVSGTPLAAGSAQAPASLLAALQTAINPNQAADYNDTHRSGPEAVAENLVSPAMLLGKANVINDAGKSEAVGNLVKHLVGNQAVTTNPIARAASRAELISQLPVTAPVEGAQKLLGKVGQVTGLGGLNRGAQAAHALDTDTANIETTQRQIDAAYSDVAPESRPTPQQVVQILRDAQGGDEQAVAKARDLEQRLTRAQTGTAAAPQTAPAAPTPAPRDANGAIISNDPSARPALPGEAPAPAADASPQVLQGALARAASRAVTAAQTPALDTAAGNAQRVQMQEIVQQFRSWDQQFPDQGLGAIADRLESGAVSPDEKHTIAVVYNVMKQGEKRAPVAAGAEAAVPAAEAAAPAVEQAAQDAEQPEQFAQRYNAAFPEDAMSPEEAQTRQLAQQIQGSGDVAAPTEEQAARAEQNIQQIVKAKNGSVSPTNGQVISREEAAQALQDAGHTTPDAIAEAIGVPVDHPEVSALSTNGQAAAQAAEAPTSVAAAESAVAPDRLTKLFKAAKRDGIDEIVAQELEDKSPVARIAQQIKSIFPAAKTDEELNAVIQRVAQERGLNAVAGSSLGTSQDDQGNLSYDPLRGGLGLVAGAVAPGNTRFVFKGEVPEQLIAALGAKFGSANVSRGAANVIDMAANGRITEKALRDFVTGAAQNLGLDTTDALVAHPQGSDIGLLIQNADDKLAAMVQRVLPKGATVTPTEDGLQVLLRQTPSGTRGAGTSAQQAALSRQTFARVAEAVKAHGLNPDEVIQAGRPRIEPLGPVSAQAATSAAPAGTAVAQPTSVVDRLNQLLGGGGTDAQALVSATDKQQAVSSVLDKDKQAAQDILSRIQQKVPQAQIATGADALKNSYAQRVAGDDLKQLQALTKKYGFDVADPAQWAEHSQSLTEKGLLGKYQEGIPQSGFDKVVGSQGFRLAAPAATLGAIGLASAPDEDKAQAAGAGVAAGLLSGSPLGKALGASLKQILLLSPRYHINNISDVAIKSVLNGIKPWLDESVAAGFLKDWGQLTPEGAKQITNLDGGFLQAFKNNAFYQKGVRVNPQVVEGFSSQIGDTPALVNFLKLSKPAQINRQIAQNFERVARLGAYIQGKQQYLTSQLPGFADELAQVSPEVATALRQSNGRMSVETLTNLMDQSGVQGQARARALGEWNKLLSAGDQAGADLANKIHFNYRYTTSFDDLMGQVMLFHIYSTRNLVYYPQLLAEHPMVAASLLKMEQESSQEQDQKGLTSRFLGSVPAGQGLSKLTSLLFGHNGEAFINPAQYVSIVQQVLPLAKQAKGGEQDTTPVGAAVEGARNLGFGINPIGELALGATGALGSSVPAQGVLTPLQPITAALRGLQGTGAIGPVGGSTIEADPTVGLTSGLIGALGTDVTDFSQLAIKKRLAEMAVEQGKAPGAYDAIVDQPTSPIYKEAVRQVAAEQATKGALSYGTGQNVQFLPDVEAQTREARKGLPPFNPNANALQRAVGREHSQQANTAEAQRIVSTATVTDTFSRTLSTDPQGVAKAARALGADVSATPDGTVKVTVQGTPLNQNEMRQVLDYYQTLGGKLGLPSQTYSGINRDPADLAQTNAKNKLADQQVLAAYQAASPSQKVAMLQDPNINFLLSQQQKHYTSPGAYR